MKDDISQSLIMTRALSFIMIAFFATSCSLDVGEVCAIVVSSLIISTIIVLIVLSKIGEHMGAKRKAAAEVAKEVRRQEKLAQEQAAAELKHQKYEKQLSEVISVFGPADKTIKLGDDEINNEIRAYASHKKVFIIGRELSFDEILQCLLSDNPRIIKGKSTIVSEGTSSADTGNVLGRTIVGGIIGGGVGAAIGGAIAERTTNSTSVVSHGRDRTIHDYTISISVKNIADPLIEIKLGEDSTKANEIYALMNAIIASK